MREQISLLIILLLIGATLCALMTLAWRSFDRPPHARLWAWAFGLSCVQWAVNLAFYALAAHPVWMVLAVNWLSVVVSVFWLEGFRRRARRGPAWASIVPGILLVGALVTLFGLTPIAQPLGTAVAMLARTVLLVLCAALVAPPSRPANAAELGTSAFLIAFAGFSLLVAALSGIRVATGADAAWEIARVTLRFGIPAAFTGLGLFSVFLIASDLCEQMRGLAAADPLTGLLNRRGFDEAAMRALAHARRHAQPVSVVITDADRFKAINDRFGHAAGDRAIQRFAAQLRACVRIDDLVGRTGGDEFVMLLLGTDGAGAGEVVTRLRTRLADDMEKASALTASFGIASVEPEEPLQAALHRADEALYQSKQDGRDRVTVAESPPRPRPLVRAVA